MLFCHGINLIVVLGIFCDVISSQSLDFGTDCDVFYNKSCFIYISELDLPWENSRQNCITRGGHLTSINSENENEMLQNLVANYPENSLGTSVWIGLNYSSYNESSNWEDGNPLTYTKMLIINAKEGCIAINGHGTWVSTSCSSDIDRHRICRKPGSAFAIRENGQYQTITNDTTTTISSILPTILACRTDTYPQSNRKASWEYKATGSNVWNSMNADTRENGISELTVTAYGSYRCHVKSGGAEQIYTTVLIPTTTGTPSISTKEFTSTSNDATPYLFLNSKRSQALFGGLITLILILVLLCSIATIISIFIVILCKRRNRAVHFKRINEEENRIKYEKESQMRTDTEIEQPSNKAEYLNISDVMNQMTDADYTPSDDYVAMAEVEHTAKELINESPYQNLQVITQENLSKSATFGQMSETEIRKQFKILNSECSRLRHHQATHIANEPNNKPKNSIENIVPYDYNRVVLMTENNYINASYICNNEFIITIHPMQNTLPDFLQMLYQTEASLVVMLTTKKELSEIEWNISNGVTYWGQQGSVREYEQFVVKTSAVTKSENAIIHTLILHNANENRENTFKQITSIGWEDQSDIKSIVNLVETILAHKNEQPGPPIVIHCSDGIRKSAVLATVLKVIEEIEGNANVDVNEVVKRMRMERKYCVPSLIHYSYCYSILQEYYKTKYSD
ncbi:Receptor-type tyrosine-protein phosphatase alpha [Oopsacas minuta]|uniref:Receptor-type tyrosine-protein phosphatase alpha n=1 Tax=Oopsacas minuta TaxID=111878 RepID=A0AAV7JEF0_9METZ|nr:Receptor-type tyrosine-protein phosphatase alpha [Oopsacas minuta]